MLSKFFMLMLLLAISSLTHADKVTYYYTDPTGTVLAETDAQGNVTKSYDYRPYGEQALGQPPDGFGYTGHVNDPDTGLVYMQARYYDPEMGRFLSVDPVSAYETEDWRHFNRYAYAYNNPMTFNDPDGRMPWILLVPVAASLMAHADYANAPGPNDARVALTTSDHLSAAAGALPPGRMAATARIGIAGEKQYRESMDTSRGARRESMRGARIPTSQQPVSQSRNASGREYSYDVPGKDGGTQRMSVQQQTMDRSHPDQPHWEAGKVRMNEATKEPRMNNYGRPKLDSDKAKVDY
jgi:RHS repeat-associated protein